MKNLVSLIIILLIMHSSFALFSQSFYSVNSGSYETELPVVKITAATEKMQGGIPCNPGTFWANNNAGSIIEYSISGSIISSTGVTYPVPNSIRSVIYANSLTGFNPTFYNVDTDTISRFDGAGWPAMVFPGISAANGGGNGDHIYTAGYVGSVPMPSTRVFHYNITSSTIIDTIYTTPAGRNITMADYSVDTNGNCYFLVGVVPNTDTLVVINPSGSIINTYALPLNTGNAYGSFMMGNILYIGLGSANPVYPNSLIPITITPTTATIGTPISFPGSFNYVDLESCNQGSPLGLMEPQTMYTGLTVSPNPATDYTEILLANGLFSHACEMNIYNLTGQLIRLDNVTPAQNKIRIGLQGLKRGMYFISIRDSGNLYTAKMIKD